MERAIVSPIDPDARFFAEHPDRYCHIRKPALVLAKDKQRAMRYVDECEEAFASLGYHNRDRRRIILWRMPADNRYFDPHKPQILKIPFLLFADETVEDTDEILRPIIHELMVTEAAKQGVVGNG